MTAYVPESPEVAMRHDPASAAIVIMLRSPKLYGMAQAATDLIEQGAPAFDAAVPILSQLLKAELAEREVRSIAYHMKAARFPAYKDLSGFDFTSSEINEATVRQLHRCEYMDGAQNVVLIGGPGTGKTHMTALGVQAIEHHRRKVRFFSTIELVNAGCPLNGSLALPAVSLESGVTGPDHQAFDNLVRSEARDQQTMKRSRARSKLEREYGVLCGR
jgi:hypothetical protein